ncbi:MAG: Wzz/FepE/Etk N-terminal domain-containing protein [Pseudomonadota bacterium]
MGQDFDIAAIFGALRRRFWIILVCVLVLSPIAAFVAYILPPVYRSTAKILVESQQIPDELAQSTVTASTQERLQLIEQWLLSRQNLLDLAERLELFADRPAMSPTAMVATMRANTLIEPITLGGRRSRAPSVVSAFTISYTANTALRSARVANELVTLVLDQNVRSRSERASETTSFFRQEVERFGNDLIALEAEITRFKENNEASLPEGQLRRRDQYEGLSQQIFDLAQRKTSLEQQREILIRSQVPERLAVVLERERTPEERELESLRRSLTQARAVYAASHPQVRQLEARIAAVEAVVEEMLGEEAIATPGEDDDSPGEEVLSEEERMNETARQIALIETELQLIDEQRTAAEARLGRVSTAIDASPQVEMELNAYSRAYAELQARYTEALAKQAAAETGERLEVNRQAERFELIEEAQVPERPESPNRTIIAGAGFAGSVFLGIAIVVLLELLNRTIRTPADLERRLNFRPVVVVPFIELAADTRRRRARLGFWLIGPVAFMAIAAWAMHTYVVPLDLLADRFASRLGFENLIWMIERRLGL